MAILDKFDKIISKGVEKGSEKIAEGSWVDSLAARGKAEIVPALPEGMRDSAEKSIAKIAGSKNAIGTVSASAFTQVTSYLALGMEQEARLVYLRERASHDERQSAIKKAMGVAYDASVARAEAWDEVKATALYVLKTMGQAALPLLLAAL